MLYDAGTRYFIPKRIAMLSMVAALSALLSACHSLPSSELSPYSTHRHSHTLSAGMPLIDSQGRIAYIEEQGTGKAKISRLYSIRPDGSKRQLIDQIKGYIYAPSWSADGKRLAYSKQALRQQPKIYIYDSASRSSRLIVDAPGSHLSPSFSPDGQKLLYSSTVDGDADIYELNLSDGHTRQLTTLPSTEVQPSYASDGQSFVYTSDKVRANHPRLYRYRFATAKATRIPTAGYAASAQLSLDGQHMGYLNGQSAAIMNVTSGQVIALSNTGLDEPARLSPSGRYAIYPTRNAQGVGSLVVHSLSDHTSYSISSQAGGVVRSPVWGR
ncbi:PD40 domain-containing protein [Psychrobacter sp. F1192]|uniref:PD40 domain-containing protein n=2 Tax=Psychrobacter coccoides TaxID=2818440 RepID=A0ABS3NR85_9GAMM|nr:PD40 domain-containing protein [Psychrobacter coccoides]